jgi:uncharacterized protein (TIGR00290 family)
VALKKTLVSWSSGKDSAYALHVLRQDPSFEVVGLFTTVNLVHERVAMHGVRRSLLLAQAESAGLPLWEVSIPSPCSNAEYESKMRQLVERALADQVRFVAFGDLFLEDIRRYREERLAGTGLTPLFPLWQRPTRALAREMLNSGLAATVTSLDPKQLPAELCGRAYDEELLARLPSAADPCGENGEFHTFVTRGPMLARPLDVVTGETVERDGFVFTDLRPA